MTVTPYQIVEAALEWIGTPYRHQAACKGAGCDCLGLIIGVRAQLFGTAKVQIPPYSPNWRDQTHADALLELAEKYLTRDPEPIIEPGRIMLMQMAPGYPLKHCGIITKPTHFIHAQERVGVTQVALTPWWKKRIRMTFQFQELS